MLYPFKRNLHFDHHDTDLIQLHIHIPPPPRSVDIFAGIIVCLHFVTQEPLAFPPGNLPFRIELRPICRLKMQNYRALLIITLILPIDHRRISGYDKH